MTQLISGDLPQRVLALVRNAPRRSAGVAGVLLLSAFWWHHAHSLPVQLLKAENLHYPDGARQCLQLGSNTGINFQLRGGMTGWLERTELTKPTAHPFVFYAGPAQNIPDLVIDLEQRGLLVRHTPTITADQTSSEVGPQTRAESGAYYHPVSYHNTFRTAPVVIFTVKRNDPRFLYRLQWNDRFLIEKASFPVRVYDTHLPESGRYSVPVVFPYMVSIASAACLPVQPREVTNIRPQTDPRTGNQSYRATVVFSVDKVPAWMDTAVFRRTVGAPDFLTPGSRLRRETVFQVDHGTPIFRTDYTQ